MRFDCTTYHGEPFNAEIEMADTFVRCAIRNKWLAATPEEYVRQTLLRFFLDVLGKRADIWAEHADLDIAIYPALPFESFRPALNPVLIVETKHANAWPLDTEIHERQIIGYLRRTRCTSGLLANCGELFWYEQDGQNFTKQALNDLMQVEVLLEDRLREYTAHLIEHHSLFRQAANGNFDSFRKLLIHYGQDASTTISFVVERDNQIFPISAFLLRTTGENVQFRIRGSYTTKLQSVTPREFRRLVRVTGIDAEAK